MLEHPDRDDAVELTALLAIIAKNEPHLTGQARFSRTRGAHPLLLGAERDSRDISIRRLREIETEAAPAGADIKDAEPRPVEQ